MITKEYFNKWILRVGFLSLIVLWFVAFSLNGFNRVEASFCCSSYNEFDCDNSYFNADNLPYNKIYNKKIVNTKVCKYGDLCRVEKVSPGECLYSTSHALMRYYNLIAINILALTFVINHFYNKRKKVGKERKHNQKYIQKQNERKLKENEHRHGCGCITNKINGVIDFPFMCNLHQWNLKYPWVALRHPPEKELNKNENNTKSKTKERKV